MPDERCSTPGCDGTVQAKGRCYLCQLAYQAGRADAGQHIIWIDDGGGVEHTVGDPQQVIIVDWRKLPYMDLKKVAELRDRLERVLPPEDQRKAHDEACRVVHEALVDWANP